MPLLRGKILSKPAPEKGMEAVSCKERMQLRLSRKSGNPASSSTPSAITLEEIGGAGYFEIHIKCVIDDEMWECLKMLAKKHAQRMEVSDHLLAVYGRPVVKE